MFKSARTSFRDLVGQYLSNLSGATLIEYGIALIVAILVGGVGLGQLADSASVNMAEACHSLETEVTPDSCPV